MDDKEKSLELALAQIAKEFGQGAVMRLGDDQIPTIDIIPTGCLGIDKALGIGGLPRGRMVEIYGGEGLGKTSLALSVIAQAQKNKGTCAFIDSENALSLEYADALGVDTSNLLLSQPNTGEEALEIADTLIRSGAIEVLVIDSVAALVPKAELEGDMGDMQIGLQARLMSKAMRKLTSSVAKTGTVMIFINQTRQKIGGYGGGLATSGGNALKFYSSVRIDLGIVERIKDHDEVSGTRVRVKIVKNKLAPPFKQCEVDVIYGQGFSNEGSLMDLGTAAGVLVKAGAWLSYGDIKLGNGRENCRRFLLDNPEVCDNLEREIRKSLGVRPYKEEFSIHMLEEAKIS